MQVLGEWQFVEIYVCVGDCECSFLLMGVLIDFGIVNGVVVIFIDISECEQMVVVKELEWFV